MALIHEDGTGKTDAESFLSVADADAYFSVRGDPSDWSDATNGQKESALRIASEFLRDRYQGLWKGFTKKVTQALPWPRIGVLDENGNTVDENSVPRHVKDATAEAALRERGTAGSLDPDVDSPSGSITQEKLKVGPIELDTGYAGAASQRKRFPAIDRKLEGVLVVSNTMGLA